MSDLVDRVAAALCDHRTWQGGFHGSHISDVEREAWRDDARKAIAAVHLWQPIETAPKDGTSILACDARAVDRYLVVSWNDANGLWGWTTQDGLGYHDETLTHWMLLPEQPK